MNNNNDNDNNLYFELKYLEELSDLFNEFKFTDNYYGLNLFNKNYIDFFDFVNENVIILDNYDENETDDEFYDENI